MRAGRLQPASAAKRGAIPLVCPVRCKRPGPNGAGKTTTLRMLLGLIRRDGGSVRLFGRDPEADPVAALAGVAGFIEEPRLYTYLTGRANLELLAALDRGGAGRKEIDEVLELVELDERAGDKVGQYSQGMRQRLGLASCLIRRPRLLLLDEPANGVDPVPRSGHRARCQCREWDQPTRRAR